MNTPVTEELRARIEQLERRMADVRHREMEHVVATSPYSGAAGSGSGVESHGASDANRVWVRPFILRGPMDLRRFTTWFSSTVGNTCEMFCGLYRYTNWRHGVRNAQAPAFASGALTEAPPVFDLIRPLMGQVYDASGDTIREVSFDLERDLRLSPGAYGLGYQVETTTGTWYWTPGETTPTSAGMKTDHEAVAMGRLPRQILARLGSGCAVPAPYALLRSHAGVRASFTAQEITG